MRRKGHLLRIFPARPLIVSSLPDAEYFLQTSSAPCLYLETIHEETSDDLRSDSDLSDVRASPLGWLATDSETDSVICMDATSE